MMETLCLMSAVGHSSIPCFVCLGNFCVSCEEMVTYDPWKDEQYDLCCRECFPKRLHIEL